MERNFAGFVLFGFFFGRGGGRLSGKLGQPRGIFQENYVPDFIPHLEFPESVVEPKAPLICLGIFEIVEKGKYLQLL